MITAEQIVLKTWQSSPKQWSFQASHLGVLLAAGCEDQDLSPERCAEIRRVAASRVNRERAA